jgi:hypothetical protein
MTDPKRLRALRNGTRSQVNGLQGDRGLLKSSTWPANEE